MFVAEKSFDSYPESTSLFGCRKGETLDRSEEVKDLRSETYNAKIFGSLPTPWIQSKRTKPLVGCRCDRG